MNKNSKFIISISLSIERQNKINSDFNKNGFKINKNNSIISLHCKSYKL